MKNIVKLLLGLVCAMALVACGGQQEQMTEEPGFALSDVQAMVDAGAFSDELEELDADIAFMLYKLGDYGLVREDLTDAAVLRSAGATCEEGAVLVLKDAAAAEKAAEALGGYLESQIDSNVDYRPAEIPKLEGATLMTRGNTVLLAVANDAAAVRSLFE